MLDALNKFNQDEALGVLSKLATQVAPEPLLEEERVAPHTVDFQHPDVLTEIRDRLGLAQNDYSDEARDQIVSFIADQISEIVLGEADEEAILSRLGDQGALRPDLYEITYPKSFEQLSGRGVRRDHIKQALNYPDDVEHVLPEDMPFMGEWSFSLYVKHHRDHDPYKNFSLLVISRRKGYQQSIEDAFRIYPTDVEVSSAERPIDLLKAFTQTYGLEIRVGNQEGRFFFLVIIEDSPNGGETFIASGMVSPTTSITQQIKMLVRNVEGTTEVSMAYSIDEFAYRTDLKKHNVQVRL